MSEETRSDWYGDKQNGIEVRWIGDDLDEIVMYVDGQCVYHAERMSDTTFWMGFYGKTHDCHAWIGPTHGRAHISFTSADGWPSEEEERVPCQP